MTSRERFVATGLCKETDCGILWEDGFWPETLERWKGEGMPDDHNFGFAFEMQQSHSCLGMNIGYSPGFAVEVLQDEGHTQIIRDEYGVTKRVKKGESGMPQFLSFPVADRASWEALKPRLDPASAGRYPQDWQNRVADLNAETDFPVTFGGTHLSGFFSFLRELCGDKCYYLFYDEPELVRDIIEFQEYRLTTFIREVTKDVRVDRQFIWEDMCYNRGPLIGPNLFKDFLLEPYGRTIDVAKTCGIQVIDVDSDGRVDELIPLWIEAGVNMLHPFEVQAGMDVNEVKKTWKDRLSIHGGVDKKELAKDRSAIDREIERIRPTYDMQGYIPHVDHAVPSDISWENYRYYNEKIAELTGTR